MIRATLALLAIMLGCALLAPPAAATVVPQEVRDAANLVWHSPCDGQWSVEVGRPDNIGTAVLPDDTSWFGITVGCSINLNPRFAWVAGRRLCQVVFHEVGHAAGAKHNNNPKSIMYAYYDGGDDVTPRCAALYPRAKSARGHRA